MKIYADLHIHSKYSRATSPDMNVEGLARWAKKKGLALITPGDFTHPRWRSELKRRLKDAGSGIYYHEDTAFLLTTEVSTVFSWEGKTRKIHNLIFTPTIAGAEKISKRLAVYGDLAVDGRPMLSLSAHDILDLVKNLDPQNEIVPAHAWTPHFGLYGSNFGFDSIRECFGAGARSLLAIETGLSSDPLMNWRIPELDDIALISNSDAHSLRNLGREANCFDLEEISYAKVIETIRSRDPKRFLMTVEFYPQEGKYHYDGHRDCEVCFNPSQTIEAAGRCPSCSKALTVGVLSRVEALAKRSEVQTDELSRGRPPFVHLIPLEEIIAAALEVSTSAKRVAIAYESALAATEMGELQILVEADASFLESRLPSKIAEGVILARQGNVDIRPGYDGEYGKIAIRWKGASADLKTAQPEFFLAL